MNNKAKRFLFYILAFIIVTTLLYVIMSIQMPLLTKRVSLFAILIAGDLYLWNTFQQSFSLFIKDDNHNRKSPTLSVIYTILYWFPSIIILAEFIFICIKGSSNLEDSVFFTVVGTGFLLCLLKMIISFIVLLYNVIARIITHFNKTRQHCWRQEGQKKLLKICVGIYAALSVVIGIGIFWGSTHFQQKEIVLSTHHAAFKHNPLKVVQLSDIHLGTWLFDSSIDTIVAKVNRLDADYIFITGDIVHSSSRQMRPYLAVLSKLHARYGIYSVMGNHDYARYSNISSEEKRNEDVRQLVAMQEKEGWHVLLNESKKLPVNTVGDSIVVAGIEYWSSTKLFFNKGDIEKTFRNIADSDYVILLSHDPHIWREITQRALPADLTLSGHTHGFQVGIDSKKIHFSPVSMLYKEWGGLYTNAQNNNQKLYVNVGIGSVGIPARFGIYPEITVLTLTY